MKKIVLFDVDGTIIDSEESILSSYRYTLEHFDINCEDGDLKFYIGLSAPRMFREVLGFSDELAKEAVGVYRAHFSEHSVLAHTIYGGMEKLLYDLKESGFTLGIATTKPWKFTHQLLKHHNLSHLFSVVSGSEMNGDNSEKIDLIQDCITRLRADKDDVLMIGDRSYDLVGARQAGILSIGVAYGFGGRRELEQYNADYIVDTVEELRELLYG